MRTMTVGGVTGSIEQFASALRSVTAGTADPRRIVERVAPLARALALSKAWIEARHYEVDAEQGFGAHLLHEEDDHTLAVMAAAWLPGRGVPPHNHGTWAVVVGVDGLERNTFWTRVDDGSRPGHAELHRERDVVVGPGDVVTFQPDTIHSVVNEGERVTLSLHVYGTHVNHTERSQFDEERKLEKPFLLKIAPLVLGLLGVAASGAAQDDPHAACASAGWVPREVLERQVPLRSGTGNAHEEVTTTSAEAQAFYDQGLNYLHGYVWIEAGRSFRQALRLDPGLAMAWMGLSRVYSGLDDPEAAGRANAQAEVLSCRGADGRRARAARHGGVGGLLLSRAHPGSGTRGGWRSSGVFGCSRLGSERPCTCTSLMA